MKILIASIFAAIVACGLWIPLRHTPHPHVVAWGWINPLHPGLEIQDFYIDCDGMNGPTQECIEKAIANSLHDEFRRGFDTSDLYERKQHSLKNVHMFHAFEDESDAPSQANPSENPP